MLNENRTHDYAFQSSESMSDRMNREYEEMETNDAEAKAQGELVGRYIKEPAADSYAYYLIVEAEGDVVTVEHLDIYDGWSIPYLEHGTIPRSYALQNIHGRDVMAELFASK